MDSDAMGYKTEIVVRFSETDMMGIVHHKNYFAWFDVARFEFSRDILGIEYDEYLTFDFTLPVVNARCKYRSPLTLGDKVDIYTSLELTSTSLFSFIYKVYWSGTSDLVAEGVTEHVLVDKKGKILCRIPEIMEAKIQKSLLHFPNFVNR